MNPDRERDRPSPWPALFARIVDIADALDAPPLTKHVACWEHGLGSGFPIVANGHHVSAPSAADEFVPPFTFHVLRDGEVPVAATPNGITPALAPETKLEVLTAIKRALAAHAAPEMLTDRDADLAVDVVPLVPVAHDAQEASP